MRDLKSLLTMCQQEKESTEGIYKSLDSAFLNMNLVGGNMHPKECQAKEKAISHSGSDKATDVTVEDNIMGTLITELANDKKYGELKMSLIKIITQGQKCYPNSKAAKYTTFCKYVPERTKNKSKSTAMRKRTSMGMSFYQRATPVDGPPVAGTHGITKDIITCCKCGRRCHISLL